MSVMRSHDDENLYGILVLEYGIFFEMLKIF